MFAAPRAAFGCALVCMTLGCVPQGVSDSSKLLDSEVAECRRLYPDAEQRPVLPRVKCIGEATVKAARVNAQYGYKNIDLDELARAQMILLAERYDAGKMTTSEYLVEKAKIRNASETQAQQRADSQAMVSAAQKQAAAASSPVSCTTIGSTTTCY